MTQNQHGKSVKLGPETLADALLGLASHNEAADSVVERLISSSEAKIKDFKAKLSALKRRNNSSTKLRAGYLPESFQTP
jgi:hypothetical protein